MKKLLFILLINIPFIGFGQGWEHIHVFSDEDQGEFVEQTTDGGYILIGTTYGNFLSQNENIIIVKTDDNGNIMWNKEFDYGIQSNGMITDLGRSIQQTTDGGYILTGINSSWDIWLIKTDSIGDTLWTNTFEGGSDDMFVQQTTDGGYILTGSRDFLSPLGLEDQVLLIKTNSLGQLQWDKTYGGVNNEYGRYVQQTIDGGYVICGSKYSNGPLINEDIYLIKTNTLGDTTWTKTFGGLETDKGYSVHQTTDNGYIICGYTESFGNGDEDVYLIKTDSLGGSIWTKTFGGIEDDGGHSVQQTNDGGYIITGYTTNTIINEYDVYLLKTDGNGDTLWTKTFDGLGLEDDEGNSVRQTSDGGYIICGTTESVVVGGSGIYLIKTDGNGNITSTFNIPTPSSNRKLEKVVDILGRDTKPQINTPFIEIYDDGSIEKKLIIEK
jgi:hypothetical protein